MRRGVLVLALVGVVGACGARTELYDPQTLAADASTCPTTAIDLQIPITTPWTDTGIDVVSGTDLKLHASGTVHYGQSPQQVTDANGGDYLGAKFFADTMLPSAVVHSLIGRVGDTPVPEGIEGDGAGFVGVDYHETMITSGRLFLGFNDDDGSFGDNSGSFTLNGTLQAPCDQ